MNEDFIDKTFADLEPFYPGSKRKRRIEKVVEPKSTTWDAHPRPTLLPNGKEIDLFTIGSLAEALGRPVVTLKLWMNEGHLPTSPYRLPTKTDKLGRERQGRRLYSRSMIESAVAVFIKYKVLHVKRVDWINNSAITDEIAEAWEKARVEETA